AGPYLGDPWVFNATTSPSYNPNYETKSGTVDDNIKQAKATVNVTPYDETYNGNPYTATGTATGVGGVNLASLLNLSGTTHTNAAAYPGDAWVFNAAGAGNNPNYTTQSGTVDDNIKQAKATVNVTPYDETYNGNPYTATGTATGVGGVNLASLLNLSGTTHTNAAAYPGDAWVFNAAGAGNNPNYTTQSGTVDDNIKQAKATVNVSPYDETYNGNPYTATGTATGVGGVNLASLLNLSGTTHTNAAAYPGDAWVFNAAGAGNNPNYTTQSGTVDDNIKQAKATVNVTPYDETYNGNPYTATGTATG